MNTGEDKGFYKMNALNRLFSPGEEALRSYPLQDSSKIPYLIGGNVAGIISFIIISLGTIALQAVKMAALCVIALVLFVVALVLIKKNRPSAASYCSTAALLAGTFVVLFFAPYINSSLVAYRNGFFVVVMMLFCQIVALRSRQLKLFIAVVMVMWLAHWALPLRPLFYDDVVIAISALVICTAAIVISSIFVLYIASLNNRLLQHALSKEEDSIKTLNQIRNAFEESKEGLNVGRKLTDSTAIAQECLLRIEELSEYLLSESHKLSDETEAITRSGEHISEQAQRMKRSVEEQGDSLTKTNGAMTEISGTLRKISAIASEQQKGMGEIISSITAQKTLLSQLVSQVDELKVSSAGIASFVDTINNISEQTNLLAMNASIEAAHAGTYGKGFSVIAQEIRSLSEETSKSAAKITETLAQNADMVSETTASVQKFSDYMSVSTSRLSQTLTSIEEILSEIASTSEGTESVQRSLGVVVDESVVSSRLVDGVAGELSGQKDALISMTEFSKNLKQRTSWLRAVLDQIVVAVADIQKYAEENTRVGEKISASVDV